MWSAPLPELAAALAGGYHRADLCYGDAGMTVATSDEMALGWARHYLAPLIRVGPPTGPVRYWNAVLATDRFAEVRPDVTGWRPLLLHWRKPGRYHRRGDRMLVLDERARSYYVVDLAERVVLAVLERSMPNLRDLARQVRELLMGGLLAQGHVVVHAAAVARDGRATVLSGAKGSGKTSVSLALLAAPGYRYMSSDRVLLRADDAGRLTVLPYPMSVRLGGGTVRAHPVLRRHLHGYAHMEAVLLPLERQMAHHDKLELTLGEFLDIVGARLVPSAGFGELVWPSLDLGAEGTAVWAVVSPDETLRRLRSVLLVPDADGWLRRLLGGTNDVTDAMEHTLRAVAAGGSVAVSGRPDAVATAVAEPPKSRRAGPAGDASQTPCR